MANLEWFSRLSKNLLNELDNTCELMSELISEDKLSIETSQIEKDPTLSVTFLVTEDDEDEKTLLLHFDPLKQEFYTHGPEVPFETRMILKTAEDVVEYIHQGIHVAQAMLLENEAHEEDNENSGIPSSENIGEEFLNFLSSLGKKVIKNLSGNDVPEKNNVTNIEWQQNKVVSTVEANDTDLKTVTSVGIGRLNNSETIVVGKTVKFYNGDKLDGERGSILPLSKDELVALKELIELQKA